MIEINYLPKEHTHKDVDRFFSFACCLLEKFPTLTLEELLKLFDQVYANHQPKPVIKELTTVWDWKSWFRLHIQQVEGITKARAFQFHTNTQRKIVMQAK